MLFYMCTGCQTFIIHMVDKGKGKGKFQPRTGHEDPEGKYSYSFTLSITSALDGGGLSTSHPDRFTPGKDPVPIVQEVGWASGPV